jgi:hypothetical protein
MSTDILCMSFCTFIKYFQNRTAHTVIVNDELEMVRKVAVMTYFKILYDWSD